MGKVGYCTSFPEGIFAPVPMQGGNGAGFKFESNPSHEATQRVLAALLDTLSLTKYQFAKLLGVSQSNLQRYYSGRRRPSGLYWARIVQLLLLGLGGVPLSKASRIDWDWSLVYWKDGRLTYENHLLDGIGGQGDGSAGQGAQKGPTRLIRKVRRPGRSSSTLSSRRIRRDVRP